MGLLSLRYCIPKAGAIKSYFVGKGERWFSGRTPRILGASEGLSYSYKIPKRRDYLLSRCNSFDSASVGILFRRAKVPYSLGCGGAKYLW